MKAKYSAMDIAGFFIQLANSLPETNITNLKLNKLCYYAQGWCLAKLDYPLFDDEIQAWEHGPVIPSVYHTYKVCGRNPIAEAVNSFDENRLTEEELNILIDVYTNYGKYTPFELRAMTHRVGSPWETVYQKGENNPISLNDIKDYFSKNETIKSFKPNVTQSNVEDYYIEA